MNLSPKWVEFLGEAGFAAEHWSALGLANAPDPELMIYAKANGFVILTHDLDFGAILAASGGDGPSVVQIRADNLSPSVIGEKVVAALTQSQVALNSGALVTIDPKRSRISLLPIGSGNDCSA